MLSFFTFGGNFVENIGKSKIIKRIHKAALSYNQYFLGKTYMFVYDNQFVEVLFKKSSFLHLTGVDTKLNAKDLELLTLFAYEGSTSTWYEADSEIPSVTNISVFFSVISSI